MLLQSRELFRGPAANIGYLDPCLDVVGGSVDMAVAYRRCCRHEFVSRQLKESYNGIPLQLRRHVRAARWQYPVQFAIEAALLEKGHRVACVLQINDAHRPPVAALTGGRGSAASPCWFMNRTNDPSRNWGSQAGDPVFRWSVRKRQSLLEWGGPLHSAPATGSPSISGRLVESSERAAPRLRPWQI